MVLAMGTTAAANSVLVKQKTLCVVLATAFAFIGITLSFLSLGLGVRYADVSSCENCCYSDEQCMENLGYTCQDNECECDLTSTNITGLISSLEGNMTSLSGYTSTLVLCGAYKWQCTKQSECRASLGLYCNGSMCTCKTGYYYDTTEMRCLLIKGYGVACTVSNGTTDYECDSSKGLICYNMYNRGINCNCPFTNIRVQNTCDCPDDKFYNFTSNKCEYVKGYLKSCTGTYFDECNSNLGLVCNKATSFYDCSCPSTSSIQTCDCQQGYYYNNASGCELKRTYLQSCYSSGGFDNCNGDKYLQCNTVGIANSCNCPSISTQNTCDCISGYYYNSVNSACEPKGQYQETCTKLSGYDSCDTSKNLVCNTGASYFQCDCPTTSAVNKCDCPVNMFYDSVIGNCCARFATGDPCTSDYECSSSICISAACL